MTQSVMTSDSGLLFASIRSDDLLVIIYILIKLMLDRFVIKLA